MHDKSPMGKPISSNQLRNAIKALPADGPSVGAAWYTTQHEHWLGWLGSYNTPGAYGRKRPGQSAEFAYNHAVNPDMLFWLIKSCGAPASLVKSAKQARAKAGKTMMTQSGAMRKVVPWSVIEKALWPK